MLGAVSGKLFQVGPSRLWTFQVPGSWVPLGTRELQGCHRLRFGLGLRLLQAERVCSIS